LAEKDDRLAQMYLGALHVLEQKANPESLVQAAHSIRELMEKTPRYLDLPVDQNLPSLKQRVQTVAIIWKDNVERCLCFDDGNWNGSVDNYLRKILRAMREFLDGFEKDYPKRKQEVGNLLREIDLLKTALPEQIHSLRVEEWQTCHKYFQGIAHHKGNVDEKEFCGWQQNLERFLLDRFSPRTFEAQATIDDIIREGESNDNA
jgi:hypothetical protein